MKKDDNISGTFRGGQKKTLNSSENFDRGTDKVLINTNREIADTLKNTGKQKILAIENRKEALDLVQNEIIQTAQELKQLTLTNAEKRDTLIRSLDDSLSKKLLEIETKLQNIMSKKQKNKTVRYIVRHQHGPYNMTPETVEISYNNDIQLEDNVGAFSLAVHTASRYLGEIIAEYEDGSFLSVKNYQKILSGKSV